MGFKLPGKSIASGTSAHRSALKMVAEQRAASALKATASPVKKDWATASKNDPNLSDYVKTRKGLEKGSAEWTDYQMTSGAGHCPATNPFNFDMIFPSDLQQSHSLFCFHR